MLRRLDLVLDWLGEHGVLVMVAALLVVVGTWGFVELADEVLEGSTQQFDEWAVNLLRKPNPDPNRAAVEPVVAVGPPWVREIFRDLTALGGMIVLALVTLAVVGYLLMARKFHAMWLVIIATGGGLILSNTLKAAFEIGRAHV